MDGTGLVGSSRLFDKGAGAATQPLIATLTWSCPHSSLWPARVDFSSAVSIYTVGATQYAVESSLFLLLSPDGAEKRLADTLTQRRSVTARMGRRNRWARPRYVLASWTLGSDRWKTREQGRLKPGRELDLRPYSPESKDEQIAAPAAE